eukprot:CAMPEP_0119139254 /NCGR_PEP_ID=MMETSP1310-20130426/27173_1 /TAXON_ID=464262 /ORGANISM="Genus nov. species nov., Strain RCC2339" /LENGTH=113 /DNA_ID=CAMNT_0007130525 /DNA_START=60 /DNA_END=398 /DNA_ORIENTATION=+
MSASFSRLVNRFGLSQAGVDLRYSIANAVERAVKTQFRLASATVFGSLPANLGIVTSDLDMVLSGVPDSRKAMHQVANKLETAGFSDVRVIAHARVPIVKCRVGSGPLRGVGV